MDTLWGDYAWPVSVFIASSVAAWFLRGHLYGNATAKESRAGKTHGQTPAKPCKSATSEAEAACPSPSPSSSSSSSSTLSTATQRGIYHHVILFRPSGGVDGRALHCYLAMLQDAKRTICLASMTLSGYSICAALRDAAQRGVLVCIIVNELNKAISADKLTADNIFFKVYRDSPACRLALHRHKDHGDSLFHQKFLLVDDKFLSYGSCNSSEASFKNHYENLLFTNDQRFLQPFRQEFWTRWKEFGS